MTESRTWRESRRSRCQRNLRATPLSCEPVSVSEEKSQSAHLYTSCLSQVIAAGESRRLNVTANSKRVILANMIRRSTGNAESATRCHCTHGPGDFPETPCGSQCAKPSFDATTGGLCATWFHYLCITSHTSVTIFDVELRSTTCMRELEMKSPRAAKTLL